MTDFFEAWDAKRAPAPVARPAIPTSSPHATAYVLAALRGEVDNLLAVPVGAGRNHQLNTSALKMFRYAEAGVIDADLVMRTLGDADGGLDYPATRKTLESAREAARRLGPQYPPAPKHTTPEVAPWETTTTDPLGDGVYVGPVELADGTSSSPSSSANGSTAGSPSSSVSATSTDAATALSTAAADDAGVTSQRDALYAAQVAAEADVQRLRRDARRMLDHEDAANAFRIPPSLPSLTLELELPDDPVTYAVDDLMPTGANVLLTAQFKTGKTTLVNNLARAWADGELFLGRFNVADLDGRVALFNYEVDGRQYRRWLRDVGIVNTDRVVVLNLRGYRLPLTVPHVEDWVVEWLRQHDARAWIVDPFARAFTGSGESENDNTAVGLFLDTLDVIKERAGVSELVLPTHTGRAEMEQGDERARGATRLDDWADVRWLLTKDKSDTRFFRATGRDVEVDEGALTFDVESRRLTLTGGDRFSIERESYRNAVLSVITNRPGVATTELRDGVRQIMRRASTDAVKGAVEQLVAARLVHVRRTGHAIGHYPGPAVGADPLNDP